MLEQIGLVALDAEMMELDLGPRPGHRGRAFTRARVAILLGESERLLS